jgi:hypothetical protein
MKESMGLNDSNTTSLHTIILGYPLSFFFIPGLEPLEEWFSSKHTCQHGSINQTLAFELIYQESILHLHEMINRETDFAEKRQSDQHTLVCIKRISHLIKPRALVVFDDV